MLATEPGKSLICDALVEIVTCARSIPHFIEDGFVVPDKRDINFQ
jgi:hypothetical protein